MAAPVSLDALWENHYTLIGVPRDATPEEIQRAYRRAVRRYHPDRNPSPEATERFLQIQEAYEILRDPEHRQAYDQTLPTLEPAEHLVNLRYTLSLPHLPLLSEPLVLYLMITLEAVVEHAQETTLLNLALVLDRSTSMKGARITALKQATSEILRALGDGDYVSVVAFDDRAEVLVPATRGGNRRLSLTAVQRLEPRGGTEIFQGLRAGYEQVVRFYSPDRINRILLITDGHTYGDEAACLDLARKAADRRIAIDALGIGSDWNDDFLDELTSITGGTCQHIAKSSDLVARLREQVSGLEHTVADGVQGYFFPPEGITLRQAFRLTPSPAPLSAEFPLRLGALPSDQSLTLLTEWLIEPDPVRRAWEDQQMVPLFAEFVFAFPSQPNPWHRLGFRLRLPVKREKPLFDPPRTLVEAVNRATLYRIQEKARRDAEAGRLLEATRRLEQLATRLLMSGEVEMARTVQRELQTLRRSTRLSSEAAKTMRFGTRALLPPPDLLQKGGKP